MKKILELQKILQFSKNLSNSIGMSQKFQYWLKKSIFFKFQKNSNNFTALFQNIPTSGYSLDSMCLLFAAENV